MTIVFWPCWIFAEHGRWFNMIGCHPTISTIICWFTCQGGKQNCTKGLHWRCFRWCNLDELRHIVRSRIQTFRRLLIQMPNSQSGSTYYPWHPKNLLFWWFLLPRVRVLGVIHNQHIIMIHVWSLVNDHTAWWFANIVLVNYGPYVPIDPLINDGHSRSLEEMPWNSGWTEMHHRIKKRLWVKQATYQ